MSDIEKRTFSLPAEQASFIDSLVESGNYASASEVVRDGLRSLQEREAAFDQWLLKEVAPVYDEMRAHPERGIPAEKVFAEIEALHAKHMKKWKRKKRK